MPVDFSTDYIGGIEDDVTLTMAGNTFTLVKSYEVTQSVLTQPSAFSLDTGFDDVIKKTISEIAKPNTEFQLMIGPNPQFTGWSDGFTVSQNAKSTTLNIKGRDTLSRLQDGFIQVEKTYKSSTYADIVKQAMTAVGLDPSMLIYDNVSNRNMKVGVPIDPVDTEDGSLDEVAPGGTQGDVFRQIKAKVGERWYHFLKRELDRAGLFLWATANGKLCLSRPDPKQPPTYRLVRDRNQPNNLVNVEHVNFKNETTHRFSEALVYGRYGSKKFGRAKAKGHYIDQEMLDLGYKRAFVAHDVNVSNEKQAAFYASRKLAEFRREGWSLQYTVAGHTVPALNGKGRSVWTTDTMVDVSDDELGIYGPHWIEAVTFRRGGDGTHTLITLMRPEDLLFGLTE